VVAMAGSNGRAAHRPVALIASGRRAGLEGRLVA
jgi:hypothetical protein